MTNEAVEHMDLIPNYILKSQIAEFSGNFPSKSAPEKEKNVA